MAALVVVTIGHTSTAETSGAIQRQACRADAPWRGPSRREVPAEVWRRDFTRRIAGPPLPPGIVAAVQAVVDDLTRLSPAVSVAVAMPGMGRWSVSQGLADAKRQRPLTADARFQVASTTKTLTALTVLQLEAEGKLRRSQTIETWFPDVPNARVTTIEHLLRHTSGLVSFNAVSNWTLDYRTPREAVAMAAREPPQFCPGSRFAYSNTNYAMLGVIVEAIEGRPLRESFRARIEGPLGLRRTGLRYPGDDIAAVTGHLGREPLDVPDRYATPFAAGGLASTADDLVTFWHALLSGRLVPTSTVQAMFTDLAPMDETGQMYYGRGVQLYDVPQGPGLMLGHSGGITGFTSVVAYVAADDMYVSVVFNDQKVPAEAGLWSVVRAVRAAR